MRHSLFIILFLLMACQERGITQAPSGQQSGGSAFVEGEILVKFKPNTPKGKIDQIHTEVQGSVVRYIESIQVYHIRTRLKTQEAIEKYKKHTEVLYAEPNYVVHTQPKTEKPKAK